MSQTIQWYSSISVGKTRGGLRRLPITGDAAWVFVKYRVKISDGGDGIWRHARLHVLGNTAPAGSQIDIGLLTPSTGFNASTNPGLGAFIYRNSNGTGAFSKTGVQLRWDYGANGVADADVVQITVLALEMVYIPQGGYSLGSGGTENGAFYKYPTTTNPFLVSSEGAITVGASADNLYYAAMPGGGMANSGDQAGPIPAAFPKGFSAFYCMKYEISQQQYVDFLNSIPPSQATNRYPNKTNNRHGITVNGNSYSTSNPYVACNFINWADMAAYYDWSGLRPMTELEYEKSCRGPLTIANEYAWGNTSIYATIYTGSEAILGTGDEVASNPGTGVFGNALYTGTTGGTMDEGGRDATGANGPLRVGAFATASSDRINAGATYYGVMEMSGDLFETIVTVGSNAGRAYTGQHGDGALDASGDANVTGWPSAIDGAGCYRGGGWYFDAVYLRVSDRFFASEGALERMDSIGWSWC